MPAYVAIFSLHRTNNANNYTTLANIIETVGPGIRFSDPAGHAPWVVCFPSTHFCSELMVRLQEHLYPKDEVVLLRVAEGKSVLARDLRESFDEFLSHV